MTSRLVYINGKFVDEKDAKVSIYDSALMFGDMIFEMTRSFNQKQFKLKEHLDRLFRGIKIYQIPIKISLDELTEICHETVKVNQPFFNKNDEHRLMINVSRGPLGPYSEVFNNKLEPTVIVSDFPLKWTISSMWKLYSEGINGVITNQKAIPYYYLDPKIKNRSRVFYQMANIEASNFKGKNNWALLTDKDGYLAEGSGCNIFIIKNKKIFTPLGKDCLIGISRDYIFELSSQLGYECIEKNIEPYDMYNADEAFVTGTPFCILPVCRLNNLEIGDGKFGKISKDLLSLWSKNVGLDIANQMKDYFDEFNDAKKENTTSIYQFKKNR
tara:strand:- start:1208 stop:2191 length:984 start_codon:yes stop_codon:yes gene_type:complete